MLNYCQREGVAFKPDLIRKNPGRQQTAKLGFNSFWGTFDENLLRSTTTAVSTPAQLFEIVRNPSVTVNTPSGSAPRTNWKW